MKNSNSLLAIAAMVGSTLFYLLGDTAVKLASEFVPVPQIIFVRGTLAAALIACAAAYLGLLRYWTQMFSWPVLVRGGFDATTTLMFTHALANMRIADATAIINAAPIAATMLAAGLLKEKVSASRWLAVLAGFAGVVFVLQPEAEGIGFYSFLALGAMLTVAGREVVTRGISPSVPSLLVTLWSAIAVGGAGALYTLASGTWQPIDLYSSALLGTAAVFLFGAYHYSVIALRRGEVSLVGPFRYAIIIWGLLVGFLVWGDVPDLPQIFGMSLIAAAGFIVLRGAIARQQ
jgi:drug/metabolite transporter (DMT)-like permease